MYLHREPVSWAELEAGALDANPRCSAVFSSPRVHFLPLLSDQGCWSGAGLDTWLPSVWNGTSEAPAVLCPNGTLWPWDNLAGPPGAWDRLDLSFCSFSLLKGP